MPRIAAQQCKECGGKEMLRLYVRRVGGKGYDPIGWICDKGHVALDKLAGRE